MIILIIISHPSQPATTQPTNTHTLTSIHTHTPSPTMIRSTTSNATPNPPSAIPPDSSTPTSSTNKPNPKGTTNHHPIDFDFWHYLHDADPSDAASIMKALTLVGQWLEKTQVLKVGLDGQSFKQTVTQCKVLIHNGIGVMTYSITNSKKLALPQAAALR